MFTDVPALASFPSVGRPTHYILPPVSHLADVPHMALCTFANTTCTNPGLILPGINVQPCCSSPKAPTPPSSPGPGHHLPCQLAADAEPSPSRGKPEAHRFLERKHQRKAMAEAQTIPYSQRWECWNSSFDIRTNTALLSP